MGEMANQAMEDLKEEQKEKINAMVEKVSKDYLKEKAKETYAGLLADVQDFINSLWIWLIQKVFIFVYGVGSTIIINCMNIKYKQEYFD